MQILVVINNRKPVIPLHLEHVDLEGGFWSHYVPQWNQIYYLQHIFN